MKKLLTIVAISGLCACAMEPTPVAYDTHEPDVLTVYQDGTMEFRDRRLPEEDVIIYPDGFGGERAAIKMRVPLKDSDFYRDSIRVNREEGDTTVTQY